GPVVPAVAQTPRCWEREGSGAEPPEDRFAGEPYRLQHLLASGPFYGSGRQSAAQSPHQIGGPASLGLRGGPALPGGLPARPPGRTVSASSRAGCQRILQTDCSSRAQQGSRPALCPQPSALYANLPDPLPSALCPLPPGSFWPGRLTIRA